VALLKAEAEKLSNNDLVAGVVEEIIDREALFALLPFSETKGKAYVYNRELTVSEGDFLDPNEAINEEASTFTEITTNLRILVGDVDVDKFLATTMDDTNDQVAIQIAQKAKGIGRKFKRTMVIGDNTGSPKEFDGLINLVSAGQSFIGDTNGAALTLELLDQVADLVLNGADALFMRPGTIRALRTLLRASGGLDPAQVMIQDFGQPVMGHNGIPVLPNDFLPADETEGTGTALTSIYAARMNEVDGLHSIFGGGDIGFVVEAVGTVQNKDAWRWRVKWYAALALKSTKSLARLSAITNI